MNTMSRPYALKRKWIPVLGVLLAGFIVWLGWPVDHPFPEDYSRLVYDRSGRLLRATLSRDQQYRFPPTLESLPGKYIAALISYEDKRFFSHPGVDPLALANAVRANIKAGSRIRGGSTITMQVCRLSNPRKRTYFNKLVECFTALKYTLHFSKEDILKMYATHVPMGGNVVGIESASHYYFGKTLSEITWAEAAMLVVLPNDPSRVNLHRSRDELLAKRNLLLKKLFREQKYDETICLLSLQEPLPEARCRIPFEAPHFTGYILRREPQTATIRSTLDRDIQHRVEHTCQIHNIQLGSLDINNLAVIVAETRTGNVRAYIGSQAFSDSLFSGQVDGVHAPRSTGSLLKPFLVANVLDRGPYTMKSKIKDIPTFYGTFQPQNASKTYGGLVTLERVLIESLNVPAVRLLNTFGVHEFYDFLKDAECNYLFRSPDGYGLSLILGGAEASLWELTRLYLSLANYGTYTPLQLEEEPGDSLRAGKRKRIRLFSEGAGWLVLNVLSQLSRPGIENYWHNFNNQIPVAWKTGTSYGQKDGWAIGVNRQWTVGVWTGNFTGRGNAALTGSRSAAPLLFDIFRVITSDYTDLWFEKPGYDLVDIECCLDSGYPAGPACPHTIILSRPAGAWFPGTCPYHRRYLIDRKSQKSVCSLCWNNTDTTWVTRFIVPAGVRSILESRGYPVDIIPEHAAHCPISEDPNRMEIVYPVNGIKILIPRDLEGHYEEVVLSVKHQRPSAHIFWYLNGTLIADTVRNHRLSVDLDPGRHKLTVLDEEGFTRTVTFTTYKNES